ncbi:MAG: transporter [Albidovulum sp.]
MHPTETQASSRPAILIPIVFTATIFLSASLLFFVQPLFAKIVLPQIGGAPAVWTTAMLFFQTVLIAGYVYAHVLTRFLAPKMQLLVHLALWATALIFLPLSIPDGWRYDAGQSPAWQTLVLFGLGVGVPFAALSANAPLIQSWYARSGGPSADDPYFLYGASNLGSLTSLLAFPLVAEPLFGASRIGQGWAIGFLALGLFLLASGFCAFRGVARSEKVVDEIDTERPSLPVIARWMLLAFIPSSMMLAVTTKISTDIGAIPLVWVIPLALYLLTFVLTFTRRRFLSTSVLRIGYLASLAWLWAVFSGMAGAHVNLLGVAGLILAFFGVALFAHTKLYEARPSGTHLTFFYVIMSVGGALGGLFNSIVAPSLFDTLAEGTVTTLLAATLILSAQMRPTWATTRVGLIAGVAAASPLVIAIVVLGMDDPLVLKLIMFAMAALVAIALRKTLPAAALAAGLVSLSGVYLINDGDILRDRSFFGTHRIWDEGSLRQYANGTTIHGAQRLADFGAERPTPLFYYHPNGPMAQVLTSVVGESAQSVGIVGLGVGALACYRHKGQDWQFYEIDQVVDDIARNPDYFTFMSACAGDGPTHMGDARMILAGQEGTRFDILVIDAYGSDAVPMHLTTHEAMELYLNRLTPDGILMYHISNRYYAIQRPLSRSAEALGLVARVQDYQGTDDEGDTPSRVVMLARSEGALGALAEDSRWSSLTSDGGRIWTDDFADLLSILE